MSRVRTVVTTRSTKVRHENGKKITTRKTRRVKGPWREKTVG